MPPNRDENEALLCHIHSAIALAVNLNLTTTAYLLEMVGLDVQTCREGALADDGAAEKQDGSYCQSKNS
jgi:hypothetical protein